MLTWLQQFRLGLQKMGRSMYNSQNNLKWTSPYLVKVENEVQLANISKVAIQNFHKVMDDLESDELIVSWIYAHHKVEACIPFVHHLQYQYITFTAEGDRIVTAQFELWVPYTSLTRLKACAKSGSEKQWHSQYSCCGLWRWCVTTYLLKFLVQPKLVLSFSKTQNSNHSQYYRSDQDR